MRYNTRYKYCDSFDIEEKEDAQTVGQIEKGSPAVLLLPVVLMAATAEEAETLFLK